MSKSIAVGDLVCVTRPRICCGECSGIGRVFRVPQIKSRIMLCGRCGRVNNTVWAFVENLPCGTTVWCEISRLIRIDPPALADETRQDEKLTA